MQLNKSRNFLTCCRSFSICPHVSYTAYKVWSANMGVEGNEAYMCVNIKKKTGNKML